MNAITTKSVKSFATLSMATLALSAAVFASPMAMAKDSAPIKVAQAETKKAEAPTGETAKEAKKSEKCAKKAACKAEKKAKAASVKAEKKAEKAEKETKPTAK